MLYYYPRVLVIANNSFSNTDNNGRTLGNLFIGWPKEKLAQFCISTDRPNFDICDNYYCTTDKDVLNSFLHLKKANGTKLAPPEEQKTIGSRGEGKKSLFRVLVRDIIWSNHRWESDGFKQWVKDFKPEVILLFFGDAIFMLDIATKLSKEYEIPLVIFNTEGYYFFKSNYYRTKTIFDRFLFPLVQGLFRRQVKVTMKNASYSIYLNQMLQADYDKEFGVPSSVLYTTSALAYEKHIIKKEAPIFSYIGNLTLNRPKALMEVADVLQSINTNYKLDVYGTPLNEATKKELINHPGITFKGFVSFDEVLRVMRNSDILFHAETQDKKWAESLKYGFSTKIADSISSGACFVLYSSSTIACAQYIKETKSGWFAESKDELRKCIEEVLNNEERREDVLKTAQRIALENHNVQRNSQQFHKIICDCYYKQINL